MAAQENKAATKLGRLIGEEQRRWSELWHFGGSDPFYEDGVNLNLVRNHIIYYHIQCEEELEPSEFPAEYSMPIPPEVDNNYMARKDEILEHSRKSLQAYIADENYQYLLRIRGKLNNKQKDEIHLCNVLMYVSNLRKAIGEGNFVEMRRHEYLEIYIDSFLECRRKAEAMLGTEPKMPIGQLSIFDLFGMQAAGEGNEKGVNKVYKEDD